MAEAQQEDRRDLPQRLSSVEAHVGTLYDELHQTRAQMTEGFNSLNASLQSVRESILARSKTDWGPIFAGASVFVVMSLAVFGFVYGDIGANRRDIADLQAMTLSSRDQVMILRDDYRQLTKQAFELNTRLSRIEGAITR